MCHTVGRSILIRHNDISYYEFSARRRVFAIIRRNFCKESSYKTIVLMTVLINSLQRISHPIEESRRSRHTTTSYYIIIGKAVKIHSRVTSFAHRHYIFVRPYIAKENQHIFIQYLIFLTRSRYSLMILAIFNRLTSFITRSNIIRDKSIVTDNVALLCRMPENIVVSWLQITHI